MAAASGNNDDDDDDDDDKVNSQSRIDAGMRRISSIKKPEKTKTHLLDLSDQLLLLIRTAYHFSPLHCLNAGGRLEGDVQQDQGRSGQILHTSYVQCDD